MNPRIKEFIIHKERCGKGTDKDPVRMVTKICTLKGDFLVSYDPVFPKSHNCINNEIENQS